MATVKDAIEALTDPECLLMDGGSHRYKSRGVVGISGSKVVNRLRSLDAPVADDREALDLARQAAAEIGAREIVETLRSRGLRPGNRPRDHRVSTFEVPVERLRAET
jgi:hypothetical protein